MSEIVEWLAGINTILGAWLVAVPFVFADAVGLGTGFAFWNYIVVGAAIVVLSGYDWWVADDDHPGNSWAAGGSAILGLWIFITPFVTAAGVSGLLLWNDVIVGGIVAVLAGYNAYESSTYDTTVTETAT
ncbi:MAG: SPW repeat protein [Haloarculaceae archaeon]